MTVTPGIGGILSQEQWYKETGYTPHPGQRAIHNDNARHRVIANGRRWGKTLFGGKEVEPRALVLNRYGQPQTGWIVGPNYADAEKEFRVIWNTFRAQGIEPLCTKFVKNPDSGNMKIATQWGFNLECRSAAHPETLVGEGLDFVLMVEAGRQKWKTWSEYIRPTLSDRRGISIHSGVPEGPSSSSLLYNLFQRGQSTKPQDAPWRSWQMPSWTNTFMFPGGRQDPEILEAEADLTTDEFNRQYGAQFSDKTGRVMTEWDDDFHLVDLEYDPQWPLYAGVDYGFTNPLVWLWIQVDVFNNVYVIGEHYVTGQDTPEFVRNYLKPHPFTDKLVAFYPDPAEPDDTKTIADGIRKPHKGGTGGELKTRLMLIREALKLRPEHVPLEERQPKLFIDRSCVNLAWEMREGYKWPEKKSDIRNSSEMPMDKDNHGPEALGRFFKGHFGSDIEKPLRTVIRSINIRR